MKRVLLLGATGTAGSALTKKLLSDTDDYLTLFARHATDRYTETVRTSVVNGDATNLAELKAAMAGQEVVYCAISGDALPEIAEKIVQAMEDTGVKRLIFMAAVGIYNEIPDDIDGNDNLDNEPKQIPNRKAADIIEASNLCYTVLRPGYLIDGDETDFVLTVRGEPAKGYTTPIPALVGFAQKLIQDENLYARESVSITHDATAERKS